MLYIKFSIFSLASLILDSKAPVERPWSAAIPPKKKSANANIEPLWPFLTGPVICSWSKCILFKPLKLKFELLWFTYDTPFIDMNSDSIYGVFATKDVDNIVSLIQEINENANLRKFM